MKKKTKIVLIIAPSIYPEKGVELDFLPHLGDQINYKGKSYYVKFIFHNLDDKCIKVWIDPNEIYKTNPLAHLRNNK